MWAGPRLVSALNRSLVPGSCLCPSRGSWLPLCGGWWPPSALGAKEGGVPSWSLWPWPLLLLPGGAPAPCCHTALQTCPGRSLCVLLTVSGQGPLLNCAPWGAPGPPLRPVIVGRAASVLPQDRRCSSPGLRTGARCHAVAVPASSSPGPAIARAGSPVAVRSMGAFLCSLRCERVWGPLD